MTETIATDLHGHTRFSDGRAEPGRATRAFFEAALELGVSVSLGAAASRIDTGAGRVTGVRVGGQHYRAPLVLCAAGAGSGRLLRSVGLAQRADVVAATLAHGEQRQLEIAMALATRPRLLLLDEPMAGLGADESQRMIAFLRGLKDRYTIVLVEHDMDAVFALADRISVMVYGRLIATGSPEEVRANPDVRQAYLGEDERP